MGQLKGGFGEPRWKDLLLRQPRIVQCSGPVLLTSGGVLRGYSRVVWIPSSGGAGHHINLDPPSGSAYWEFTLNTWDLAYIRLNNSDLGEGSRIGITTTDPRFRIENYGAYKPHPNDLLIAIRNGDIANVSGGGGSGRVFTAWGQIVDSWHMIGAAGEPAFLNGWLNYGPGYECGFQKLANGLVVFRGLMKAGTINAPAFTLPPGFRPVNHTYQVTQSHDGANYVFGTLTVYPNGDVRCTQISATNQVSLWPLVFPIES